MTAKKILVVDDNTDFCSNIKDILELEGYEVNVANDGKIAIDLISRSSFDLILMDLIMPGMDGVTTIKSIRQKNIKIPVLVITAWGEEAVVQSAMEAGANNAINKPVDFKLLFSLLDSQEAF